jgi:hypothetical protein
MLYFLFAFNDYEAAGGLGDYVGSFETVEELHTLVPLTERFGPASMQNWEVLTLQQNQLVRVAQVDEQSIETLRGQAEDRCKAELERRVAEYVAAAPAREVAWVRTQQALLDKKIEELKAQGLWG